MQSDQSKLDGAVRRPPNLREVMVTRKSCRKAVNRRRQDFRRGSVPRRLEIRGKAGETAVSSRNYRWLSLTKPVTLA